MAGGIAKYHLFPHARSDSADIEPESTATAMILETPARKVESLYDLQCKINACFSTDLDAEIDRPSQELSTMTIWQILIIPKTHQSMAFIRLRLILQRQTSGRSRLCLLPF